LQGYGFLPVGILAEVLFGFSPLLVLIGAVSITVCMIYPGFMIIGLRIAENA
jgi:hypothetical protein